MTNRLPGPAYRDYETIPLSWAVQIESGIKAIQVQVAAGFDFDTKCFVLFRTNGTSDDFSVRKCLAKLFPATYQVFPPRPTQGLPQNCRISATMQSWE